MQVFAEILGVPQDERREIIELGDRLLGNQDPEYAVEPEEAHKELPFSSPAALEMFEFGRRLAAERRKQPGDDIITQLAFEPLAQHDFDNYFVLLATAGNETTRHTITHGLLALLEHPEELQRLRDDPSLGKTAAEEMLRWATPVHHFRRTAAQDTELAGRQIKAGDKVTTWFVSGNRDEDAFEQPERFDLQPPAQPPHGVRPRRHPPLHGRAPGQDGGADRVRGAAPARQGDRAGRPAPSGCGPTSSTASSGCRCGWSCDRPARPRRAARGRPRRGGHALGGPVRADRAVAGGRTGGAGVRRRAVRARADRGRRARVRPRGLGARARPAPGRRRRAPARARRRVRRGGGPGHAGRPGGQHAVAAALPRAGVAAGGACAPRGRRARRPPAQARPRELPDRAGRRPGRLLPRRAGHAADRLARRRRRLAAHR